MATRKVMAEIKRSYRVGVLAADHTEFIWKNHLLICQKIQANELRAVGHKENLDYRLPSR
jgi:hypothetical protein